MEQESASPRVKSHSFRTMTFVSKILVSASCGTLFNGTGECESTGDVTFILDSSGSVGEVNFDRVRNFTISAVRDLEIDNGFFRISLVTFRSVATCRTISSIFFQRSQLLSLTHFAKGFMLTVCVTSVGFLFSSVKWENFKVLRQID